MFSNASLVWLNSKKYKAPVLERQIAGNGARPVLDEGRSHQHAVRQDDRAAEDDDEQRQRGDRPRAEPDQARAGALAADHRVAATAHDRGLRAQQRYRDQQQRQRHRSGQAELRWKLEQAPDLGGHRVDACRQRQDRRCPEQRHRLQKCDQETREQRRHHQWQRYVAARCATPGAPRIAEASSSSLGMTSRLFATKVNT